MMDMSSLSRLRQAKAGSDKLRPPNSAGELGLDGAFQELLIEEARAIAAARTVPHGKQKR